MATLKKLDDLFLHQLKDLYSAEKQLINALPEMEEKASHQDLKDAFADHLEETKEHKKRLDKIAEKLDFNINGETCNAMKGLIKEAKSFLSEANPLLGEKADDDVKDAGMIADAQRVEHYEISAYGTVIEYAKALGYDNIANTLQETQNEESNADQILNNLAIENVNRQARNA